MSPRFENNVVQAGQKLDIVSLLVTDSEAQLLVATRVVVRFVYVLKVVWFMQGVEVEEVWAQWAYVVALVRHIFLVVVFVIFVFLISVLNSGGMYDLFGEIKMRKCCDMNQRGVSGWGTELFFCSCRSGCWGQRQMDRVMAFLFPIPLSFSLEWEYCGSIRYIPCSCR